MSKIIRFLSIVTFCLFILLSNVFVNGRQKLLNFEHLDKKLGQNRPNSSFVYFKANPQGLIVLVKEIADKVFFAAVPLVHLVFLAMVLLTRKWTNLWAILNKIQRKMKLDPKFHQKCRKYCLAAALFLLLVKLAY